MESYNFILDFKRSEGYIDFIMFFFLKKTLIEFEIQCSILNVKLKVLSSGLNGARGTFVFYKPRRNFATIDWVFLSVKRFPED